MPIFNPLNVPRTNTANQHPILFDGGRAEQGFFTPSNEFFGWEVIPHNNKWADGTPSFMAPPSHYHLLQSESFHVKSGSGYWYVGNKKITLKGGDDIVIPRFVAHRFEAIENEAAEPLVILYRYDSQRWEMEERFFRNSLPYMWDCKRAGVEPSIIQLCVFCLDAWMPVEVIKIPWVGEYVRCAVNTVLLMILAGIGMGLFGYKRSYPEYFDKDAMRKRIDEESRKVK